LAALVSNGITVETAVDGALLYPMLQNQRFDFFPRGINEAWDNLLQHGKAAPDMVVEERLALFYPLVQCFVVAKTNHLLADRIERGLQRALADGSMKRLFFAFHQADIDRAQISLRRILTLTNPVLPLEGPVVDTRWWLPAP